MEALLAAAKDIHWRLWDMKSEPEGNGLGDLVWHVDFAEDKAHELVEDLEGLLGGF